MSLGENNMYASMHSIAVDYLGSFLSFAGLQEENYYNLTETFLASNAS